jgi:hypothetical protein
MVTCHRRTVPPGSERDVRRTARVFLLWLEYHSNRTVWEVRAQRSSVGGVRWQVRGSGGVQVARGEEVRGVRQRLVYGGRSEAEG